MTPSVPNARLANLESGRRGTDWALPVSIGTETRVSVPLPKAALSSRRTATRPARPGGVTGRPKAPDLITCLSVGFDSDA